MLVYVCLYIKYNNNCSTVSKLIVSKADSRFKLVLLLVLKNKKWHRRKLNVTTSKYLLTYTEISFEKCLGILYLLKILNIASSLFSFIFGTFHRDL